MKTRIDLNSENQRQNGIKIVLRPIRELYLDPQNPRSHSPEQIRQIAQSVAVFGFNVPILIDANKKVIAGHGRIMACELLGRAEVPTICLEHLTDAQTRAFMIADNRLTENSTWNERLLGEQLKELSVLNLDFISRRPDSRWAKLTCASRD